MQLNANLNLSPDVDYRVNDEMGQPFISATRLHINFNFLLRSIRFDLINGELASTGWIHHCIAYVGVVQ